MTDKNKPGRKKSGVAQLLRVYAPATLAVIAGFAVAFQFVEPAPPQRLVIAAGAEGGAYMAAAQRYAEILARENVTLEVRATHGSLANIALLEQGEVQVGFVQGGTTPATNPHELTSLGSMYYEPLWLFHRGDAAPTRLVDLAGKRVAIGGEGSGTQALMHTLLDEVDGDLLRVEALPLGGDEAEAALLAGEVDAIAVVAGTHSARVRRLIEAPDVRLMDMRRAETYTRLHPYLSALNLPEGVIDLRKDLPPANVRMIAPTANLVVAGDTHPALVDLLMQAAAEVHGTPDWFSRRDEFPRAEFLVYPLHPSAERFYKHGPPFLQRYLPFWAATLIDRLKVLLLPLVMVLLPLFKIMPPIYQWRMRSRIYRWYEELDKVEREMREGDTAVSDLIAELDRIENEVAHVEVPLSFSGQAYDLRMHIALVRDRLSA
ncbi:MAG: TAXI family TRAP transporter solute-binding subunit [Chromatiales bacterium]|nr:TAXI family TRAP transporter solute-binding subunit [Gammaproteobacteria bacterium]MCP5352866.1 TAXI family TRAP transporter solute-binding subunit [Chromatiales bacterium]